MSVSPTSKNNLFTSSMETRCPKLKDAQPALEPGGLDRMFERIIEEAPGNQTQEG